jgi:hypothetical protein
MYKVNSLGADVLIPIPTTLIIGYCYVELVNQCVNFPLGSEETMTSSLDHRML